MLQMSNSSALVHGGAVSSRGNMAPNNAPVQVKVSRAFYFGGKVLAVGEVVSMPRAFAAEMFAAGKVVEAPAVKEEAPAPRRGGDGK